jgi:predicted TIM-barrel enzyme
MNTAPSVIRITSTWPLSAGRQTDAQWIFCPWLEGLPAKSGLWIASLPIHDANGVLLDAIASPSFRDSPVKPAFVGVCLLDPFRQLGQIFAALKAAGIAGIVNLPTTGTFRGAMARALDDLGTGVNREIAMMAQARDHGLRIGGVAMTADIGARMIETGCEFVLNLEDAEREREIQSLDCPAGRSADLPAFGINKD